MKNRLICYKIFTQLSINYSFFYNPFINFMKAIVHIIYIKNTSQISSSLDNINVSMEVSPKFSQKNEVIIFPLKDLDILTDRSAGYFNIQKYESQSLLITISETNNSKVKPICNLLVPFSSFPLGQNVKNEYTLTPIVYLAQPLLISIEVFITGNKLDKDPNSNVQFNFKKHLINKTILQQSNGTSPNVPSQIQPRTPEQINRSPKNRQFSLPISTFNTFSNEIHSETDDSTANYLSANLSYSESSVESVEMDLSSSSDDVAYQRKDGDDSSSSYLSESSESNKSVSDKTNENKPDAAKSADSNASAATENKEKKHRHHHRHHHHHHKHHKHGHTEHKHHHRHHHHHHQEHSNSDQPRPQRRQLRPQQSNMSLGSQRLLRANIRSIASDRNIHKKRFPRIPERQSTTRLPAYKPQNSDDKPKMDNPFLVENSLLI